MTYDNNWFASLTPTERNIYEKLDAIRKEIKERTKNRINLEIWIDDYSECRDDLESDEYLPRPNLEFSLFKVNKKSTLNWKDCRIIEQAFLANGITEEDFYITDEEEE